MKVNWKGVVMDSLVGAGLNLALMVAFNFGWEVISNLWHEKQNKKLQEAEDIPEILVEPVAPDEETTDSVKEED